MRFGLSVESVQSGIQGQEPYSYDEMQEPDVSLRPPRTNADDTTSQYVLGARALNDYTTTHQRLTDVMNIDELSQKQCTDTTVTSSSDPRQQATFLQLFSFIRDRLLATVGTGPGNLKAPTEKGSLLSDVSPGVKCDPIEDDASKLQELLAAQRAVCNLTPNHREVVKSLDRLSITEPAHSWFVSPLTGPRHDIQGIVVPGDSELARGRSRTRQTVAERERAKEVRYLPRRLTSPDWNAVLGDADPSFVPDSTYHCSRCLRRMPEADDRHNAQQVSGNGEEYKFHFSGDRCCRIRNGIGSAKNLPNRSGWIPAIELPELSIIKRKFLKTHPEYAATLYPVLSSDVRNLWRSDPNNESNRANWHLPWPPHDMGACSALRPIPEVAGVSEEGGGRAAGSGRCRGRGGAVPRWSYAASAKRKRSIMKKRDADDEYNSDGTNTTGADNELAAHGQSWIMHKKKRRRLDDATYRPQRDEHPDSDDEEMLVGGGAPERLRQVRHEMEQEISSMREDGGRGW